MQQSDQDDIISLNSDASEDALSNQDWESDDQVLDLDEKTLSNFKNSLKDAVESGSDDQEDQEDEGEWGDSKNIYYDADQDVGIFTGD